MKDESTIRFNRKKQIFDNLKFYYVLLPCEVEGRDGVSPSVHTRLTQIDKSRNDQISIRSEFTLKFITQFSDKIFGSNSGEGILNGF